MKRQLQITTSLLFCLICGGFALSCLSMAKAANKEQLLNQASGMFPTNVLQWVEDLYSINPMLRGNALQRLCSYPEAAEICLPRIAELLSDNVLWDPFSGARVGEEAAGLLDHIGGEKAFEIAVAASTNRNTTARRNAIWAFPTGTNGRVATNAIPVLKTLLTDKDDITRNRAAKSLSGLDFSKFNGNQEAWSHWFENSGWKSPNFWDYEFFAIYEQTRKFGPKVYAPLDSTKIDRYTNTYFRVNWSNEPFRRIQTIEKIEKGKVKWIRTFDKTQAIPEREQLF